MITTNILTIGRGDLRLDFKNKLIDDIEYFDIADTCRLKSFKEHSFVIFVEDNGRGSDGESKLLKNRYGYHGMIKRKNMDKTFNKKQMLDFAEKCMLELLSTKPDTSPYSEISSFDLIRIKTIINKFK